MRVYFIYIQVLLWLTKQEISPLQNAKKKEQDVTYLLDKLYLQPKLDMRFAVSTNPFSPDDLI